MIRRSVAAAIAVTLHQLASDQTRRFEPEQELVLEALRRSKSELADASVQDLADYLQSMEPEQIAGAARNVKGIVHELLVMHVENTDGDGITAALKEATNYPGTDLEFSVDGEVFREVQLKAVQSPEAIIEHFTRYPDVGVLATNEVAATLRPHFGDRLQPSGFDNADLEKLTNEAFDELTGDDLESFLAEGTSSSVLIFGALQAKALLAGQVIRPKEMRQMLETAGIAAGTALTVDALLSVV